MADLACSARPQIWPVHKFFCVPKACPLVGPPITDAEVDAAWAQRHLKETNEFGQRDDQMSLVQTFKHAHMKENKIRVCPLAVAFKNKLH